MSSKRQQILDAVKARFAGIKVADGYQTDIGLKQTEHHPTAKSADPADGELPAHDVRDEAEETVVPDRNKGSYERKLRFTVVAELLETDATAANARKALADMIKAVGVDPSWGGLARHTVPVEDEVQVDEEGQRVGAARLTFEVVYGRKPWEA